MRSDADPSPARPAQLSAEGRNAAVATALLLVGALATGATSSLLLPLLVAALVFLIRYVEQPGVLLAPPAVALVLMLGGLIAGGGTGAVLLRAAIVAMAAVPGLLWRRDARRGLVRNEHTAVPEEVGATRLPPPGVDEELEDLERALAAVATRIGARTVVLWDVDGYRGTARPRASSGVRPHATIRISGDPLGWCWEQGIRMRVEQTPRWAEPGVVVVAERLRRHGDDGYIVTFSFERGRGQPDDVAVDEAAIYLRGVLGLQEASAGATSAERRLGSLLAGLGQIPGELELDSLAHDLCLTAMSITEGTGAVIGICSEDGGEVLACAGSDGGPRPGDRFTAPGSELGLALRAGSMLIREADGWSLGRTCVATDSERWQARPRALAALPLHGASGAVGVLGVWTSRGRALDHQALDLLRALSPYAALHLEHARTYGRLRETADRDPLTQLRNRRAFDQIFSAEVSRGSRYAHPLALLMVDLDHFKAINDQYGHEAGDEVLRRTAGRLQSCVREVDTVARLGGEEFVVLLPETTLAAAQEVGERIRVAVAAQPVAWRGTQIQVRASIGVSAWPERVSQAAELLGSADSALYQAKERGRNQVVAAERTKL